MENLKLYKMHLDFGRAGDLEGLFLATDEEIAQIIGQPIYFGEVLGKHSEVFVNSFNMECLKEIEVSNATIAELFQSLGKTLCGYNPVAYYQDSEEDEYEDNEYEDEE